MPHFWAACKVGAHFSDGDPGEYTEVQRGKEATDNHTARREEPRVGTPRCLTFLICHFLNNVESLYPGSVVVELNSRFRMEPLGCVLNRNVVGFFKPWL